MNTSEGGRSPRTRAFVTALMAVGLVTAVVSALGAPLVPELAAHYHATLGATQWSLTATMLSGAVVSPLVGRLGDGPHRRRVLLVCLSIVTLGGVVAALAPALWVLIAGRALQGLGLAVMPLGMAAAREGLPAARSGEVIATLSVIAAVGIGLGYPITGFIAEYINASAAFWFGALASGASLVLAWRYLPETRRPPQPQGLDVRGAVLVGAGVLALLLAFEGGAGGAWTSGRVLGLFAAAAAALGLWVSNEIRVANPLVDLRLLRHPAVFTANVTALVLGTAMYLGISLVAQVVQVPQGMGRTPFVAGVCLIPLSVTSALSTRLLPPLRRRWKPRAVLSLGCMIIGLGMGFFALTGTTVWHAMVTMGMVGLGVGFTFAVLPGLIVGAVPTGETSSAMSFYQVTRYVGFSLGAGLAVTFLRVYSGGASVPTAEAYGHTFLTGAMLCLAAGVAALLLPSPESGGRGATNVG